MPRPARLLAFLLALPPSACSSGAGSGTADAGASSVASTPGWAEADVVAALRDRFEIARTKFLQMVEAVPDDRWDYRPMEGVRSFGEIFIHIAADNWAPVWADLPLSLDPPLERSAAAFRAYEAKARPKAETLAELERSFDYLLAALDASRGRMDRQLTIGDREWVLGRMWIALATHMHEHLGQSVAYARANEIVPPWSR